MTNSTCSTVLRLLFWVGLLVATPAVGGSYGDSSPADPLARLPQSEETSALPVRPGAIIAKGLFFVYQYGVGPAKGSACPMTPSCSEYSRRAFQSKGLLRGLIFSADRLHRCGHDLRYYKQIDTTTGNKFYDPVP